MRDESEMWQRRIRPKIPSQIFYQRIENGVGAGTPDVYFKPPRSRDGWIEMKYRPTRPIRQDTLIFTKDKGLRKEQIIWWRLYLRAGGRGFFCLGVRDEVRIVTASELLVIEFNTMTFKFFLGLRILTDSSLLLELMG